ncbi:MAG: xanthine dehydrogenase molybdopterin binding subunit [Methylobacterium sp.]|uniref:xanthine dehydrogenase molybdopterin binding subunit n=1 Tax=Methylobacterium sp. TaxID=409 RepID=UPI0025F5B66E|nr:xanthine dehydrogenase molybdopterin binding subunit [Methylobacterium sp.]MBX9931003.1 xanthine dehydrogenase molybdopterin binding subunit [Methylobacterium sp.]
MLDRTPPALKAADRIEGGAHTSRVHDSAARHVSGTAIYIDDAAEPEGMLHICLGLSERAHARLVSLDLAPVRAAPGVVLVVTAADVPGINEISSSHRDDEPLLAEDVVSFLGQPIFAVAAKTRDAARRAARLAVIAYEDLPPILTFDDARADGALVWPPMTLKRGDVEEALAEAPQTLSGRLAIGGQEHFYLEGQIAAAFPGEDDEVTVQTSTQHPAEAQALIARVLGTVNAAVTTEVRRMGGGFGGKESQSHPFACIAALVAKLTGRPAKIRLDRDDDMVVTGKRHDFECDYTVGFDEDGRIRAVDMLLAARCGWAADLSGPVTDRALFHADNCYHYPAVHLTSRPYRTNTVSNTAFRGFGGPQGMVAAERVIEEVAFACGLDPLEVRRRNFYGTDANNVTPYHQTLRDNCIADLVEKLSLDCDYPGRRAALHAANRKSPVIKRGIALTPVKFGISFTSTAYNQAGALVHIYNDGSVGLNHGGTEMGQGLYVKVAQVVAEEFQIDADRVRITATTTGKVPNTSATAASSGADLNGMAARNAAQTLKSRLVEFAAEAWSVDPDTVLFLPNRVRVGNQEIPWAGLIHKAYLARIQLSATGFYKTPTIHWDRAAGRGHPFYYFAYGAACVQAAVDTLTGEYRIERADILHDCGRSLNPAIDIGQIEGGFIQGLGWLTTEELWWDCTGRLRTHAPSTYKIPACGDRPRVFNVALYDNENREETIYRSKAVGEPPLMLGIAGLHAISDAVASVADHALCPRLDAPATPERVLDAVGRMKAAVSGVAPSRP